MKTIAVLTALCVATFVSLAAASEPSPPAEFDADLAEALGADEYGMRSYVFVLLKTGPATIDDPERRKDVFAGHFANINRLADRGELVLAGPLSNEGGVRGLFILNAPSIEAAKQMVAVDPAVEAGIFVADYHSFYGSAALMQVNAIHKRVQRTTIE